jgi:hypothetical protein
MLLIDLINGIRGTSLTHQGSTREEVVLIVSCGFEGVPVGKLFDFGFTSNCLS